MVLKKSKHGANTGNTFRNLVSLRKCFYIFIGFSLIYMVELRQDAENPIIAIIDTKCKVMSCQHLEMTGQFPSQ